MSENIFILENLNCANCASKIEAKINKLPQTESAVFTFTTKIASESSTFQLMNCYRKNTPSYRKENYSS